MLEHLVEVEESIKETAKALKSDSAIFSGIVTPLWFGILKGLTERERLRLILYDLAAEELKVEARLNTRYCCNCPPDCPHARGFVTPSEVTRTALDAWRGFGYALGLDEEELMNRATARVKCDDDEEPDEPLKSRGCFWIRCALYGDNSPHKMLRCSACRQVCFSLSFLPVHHTRSLRLPLVCSPKRFSIVL